MLVDQLTKLDFFHLDPPWQFRLVQAKQNISELTLIIFSLIILCLQISQQYTKFFLDEPLMIRINNKQALSLQLNWQEALQITINI